MPPSTVAVAEVDPVAVDADDQRVQGGGVGGEVADRVAADPDQRVRSGGRRGEREQRGRREDGAAPHGRNTSRPRAAAVLGLHDRAVAERQQQVLAVERLELVRLARHGARPPPSAGRRRESGTRFRPGRRGRTRRAPSTRAGCRPRGPPGASVAAVLGPVQLRPRWSRRSGPGRSGRPRSRSAPSRGVKCSVKVRPPSVEIRTAPSTASIAYRRSCLITILCRSASPRREIDAASSRRRRSRRSGPR